MVKYILVLWGCFNWLEVFYSHCLVIFGLAYLKYGVMCPIFTVGTESTEGLLVK